MTVRKRQVGTGMTLREEIRVGDVSAGPEEQQGLEDIIDSAGTDPRAVARGICEEIVGDRRERWLAAAKRVEHAITTSKTDKEIEEVIGERDALLPPEDSEQWYAVKVLEYLDQAVGQRRSSRHEEAESWAFQAGLTVGIGAMKFEWESVTKTGAKVRLGGRKGHIKAHGTGEEKTKRWDSLQKVVDEVRGLNPEASRAEIRRLVTEKTGASESTLRRHTIDPIDRED